MEPSTQPEFYKAPTVKYSTERSVQGKPYTRSMMVVDATSQKNSFDVGYLHATLNNCAEDLHGRGVEVRNRFVLIQFPDESQSPTDVLAVRFIGQGVDTFRISDTANGAEIVEGGFTFYDVAQRFQDRSIEVPVGSRVIFTVSGFPDSGDPTKGAWQSMLQQDQTMFDRIGRVQEVIDSYKVDRQIPAQSDGGFRKWFAQLVSRA